MPWRAVVLDVDGTIAGADHRVSDYCRAVLRALVARGVTVVLATGRSERAALSLARGCGLTAPVISCLGAVVTVPVTQERLRLVDFDEDEVAGHLALAAAHGLQPFAWTVEEIHTDRDGIMTELLTRITGEQIAVPPERMPVRGVVKVALAGDPQAVAGLAAPGLTRSLPGLVEGSPRGASKADAVEYVLSRLGLDPVETLGAGDSETDVDFLAGLGGAVVPADAMPAARDVATFRVGDSRDDSVAAFLDLELRLGVA